MMILFLVTSEFFVGNVPAIFLKIKYFYHIYGNIFFIYHVYHRYIVY